MRRCIRISGLVTALTVAMLGLVPGTVGHAAAAPKTKLPVPVLLVHGFDGSGASWGVMVRRLRAAGYPTNRIDAISYGRDASNVHVAHQIMLDDLNRDFPPAGNTRYGAWWSPCDYTIVPNNNAELAGAVNTETTCLGHSDLKTDATVFAQVLRFLQQRTHTHTI